jgi:hypothetical protein
MIVGPFWSLSGRNLAMIMDGRSRGKTEAPVGCGKTKVPRRVRQN